MRIPILALAMLATAATALAQAEPSPASRRMQELHRILYDTKSTPEERRAAREELLRLLRSSDAKEPLRTMPPRAAILPAPGAVIGTQRDVPTATVTPLPAPAPPRASPLSNPATGSVLVPSGRTAIDSRTGRLVNEVPGGYLDPATGRFTPKP